MVRQVLSDYLELGQTATKRDLIVLLEHAKSEEGMEAVKFCIDDHANFVLAKRISVLDILELHRDIQLPFASFLSMLPPMRPRQYTISSSPLLGTQRATLTISVLSHQESVFPATPRPRRSIHLSQQSISRLTSPR